MKIRKPVFAGSWYPGKEKECISEIEFFAAQKNFSTKEAGYKSAGIVPHAGWSFSGELACSVFDALAKSGSADVIIVFGMHMPPGVSPVMMKEGAWQTPAGEIEVAADLGEKLASLHRFQLETPDAFAPENTIELQMPFIKYFFPGSKVLSIGVPAGPEAKDIGQSAINEAAALGYKAKAVGSTDLTHYGMSFGFSPAGTGRKAYEWVRDENDRRVIEKMLAMDAEGVIDEALANHNACCPGAAAAAIAAAKELGAQKADLLGYSSSYEKNPGDTFVGYAGIVYAA